MGSEEPTEELQPMKSGVLGAVLGEGAKGILAVLIAFGVIGLSVPRPTRGATVSTRLKWDKRRAEARRAAAEDLAAQTGRAETADAE